MNVIGLHGCYCHPFESWEDHNKFHRQKITVGMIVKNRCTQEFSEVISLKDIHGYVTVNVFPQDCKRCITIEHYSNLIQEKDFTTVDKELYYKKNQLKLFNTD